MVPNARPSRPQRAPANLRRSSPCPSQSAPCSSQSPPCPSCSPPCPSHGREEVLLGLAIGSAKGRGQGARVRRGGGGRSGGQWGSGRLAACGGCAARRRGRGALAQGHLTGGPDRYGAPGVAHAGLIRVTGLIRVDIEMTSANRC